MYITQASLICALVILVLVFLLGGVLGALLTAKFAEKSLTEAEQKAVAMRGELDRLISDISWEKGEQK